MTREEVAKALKAKSVQNYVFQYGGRCRGCADMLDGLCEKSGIPCNDDGNKAIKFVLDAISYGIGNGFIEIPSDARLTARVAELEGALELYRDAVQIDPLMEGPRFKGCNLSTLRRAWEADRAALAKQG